MNDLSARALLNVRETRRVPFQGVELREKPNGSGGSTLTFEGYACVIETGYEMSDWAGAYTEVVRSGAFDKTLAEGADVAFLVNHEGMTLARTKPGTLRLAVDTTGLHSEADLDPSNPVVLALRSALERGDLDEMSFAFRVLRQTWSPEYDQRDILEINLDKGDVSVVNYAANPATAGTTSIRSLATAAGGTERLAAAYRELRAGTLTADSTVALTALLAQLAGADAAFDPIVDAVTGADEALDAAQSAISDLLGVPDPDEDDLAGEPAAQANSLPLELFQARARAIARRAA